MNNVTLYDYLSQYMPFLHTVLASSLVDKNLIVYLV